MNHEHREHRDPPGGGFNWRSYSVTIAFAGFAAIAAFYLYTEHRAHLFGAIPYLLIPACLLMHVFMHGGHGGHGGHGSGRPPEGNGTRQPTDEPARPKDGRKPPTEPGGHHHG
jgi:hypothetical protein